MEPEASHEVQAEENQTSGFYERLIALPVITEAINTTTAVYNLVKNQHPLAQYACDTGESVVKKVTGTAYSVGTPIAGMALSVAKPLVGDPVTYLDNVATKTLDKCEENFPIMKKPPSQILETTVDAIKGKADDCYNTVNNTRIVQFTNARIHDAITLSELTVEVLLPSDPTSEEDIEEEAEESHAIQENMEEKGSVERIVALGHRIKRRGSKKLLNLKPVQFTYDSMVSIQDNMTSIINRSKEAGKTVEEACLIIPHLAIKLTGEAIVNSKAFVIAFTNAYSLKDLPGSVASVSGKFMKPVKDATGRAVAKLLLPPKIIADYIVSSKPIQCRIPNVVVFEEISKVEIEMDEFVDDSDKDDCSDDDDHDIESETIKKLGMNRSRKIQFTDTINFDTIYGLTDRFIGGFRYWSPGILKFAYDTKIEFALFEGTVEMTE